MRQGLQTLQGLRSDMGYWCGVTWDTELHGIRSYMGYGVTWDTDLTWDTEDVFPRRICGIKTLRISRS